MSREITEKLLEEDSKLLKDMERARHTYHCFPTSENEKRYRELEGKYYGENDDIRIYWKTR
jgi:hypothetical protein